MSVEWLKNTFRFYFHDTGDGEHVPGKLVRAGTARTGEFDFHIHAENDKYISQELARDGVWEAFETEVFSRLCREGEFILDIGANIGWYMAVGARLVGAAGRIHAFEPDPANYALLRRNVALLPSKAKIRTFNFAIGDKRQRAALFLSPINRGDHNLFASQEGRDSLQVEIRTLDDLFRGESRLPTLIKSDTQGSEARILRGASGLLRQGWRPDMILEFWPYGLNGSGDDAAGLWRQLDELGYATFQLLETEPRLTRLRRHDMEYRLRNWLVVGDRRFVNLLCLHRSSDRFARLADLIDDDALPLGAADPAGVLTRSDCAERILRDPNDARAWFCKARLRLAEADYLAAAEFAIAALARAPEDRDYGRLLVRIAAEAGDPDLLDLAAKRQLRLFPDEREGEAFRRFAPVALLFQAPLAEMADAADLDAFEGVLRTIRDRQPRRYVQLLQCLAALHPRSILEVGVFDGANAADMIRAGGRRPAGARALRYIGFDLFEAMTPDVHEKEFSKFPLPRAQIDQALSVLNDNHLLIPGYTQESLPAFRDAWQAEAAEKRAPVDFVFLDGGHSEATIESDWTHVAPLLSARSVVIFDDYYLDKPGENKAGGNKPAELAGLGCNTLIDRLRQDPRYLVEMLPVQDSFEKAFGLLTIALVKVRLRPAAIDGEAAR